MVDKQQKMPTAKELDAMKMEDEGYTSAQQDAVAFLKTRHQAVFKIARYYHLDPDELFQEGYEILLTCLRDYTPVYQKASGDVVKVMFTTFFGNRMESRAMEMRNSNPEYQARQAYTDKLTDEEKARFRDDPPLLVQHLDHESPMQEALANEVSETRSKDMDLAMRIVQDSFFDRVLSDLVAKEQDEKKKAALLHVKVGGIYNFQEIAYHFGVTDSRASQVLNELMDAFYVQRMIDADLASVVRDLMRMKLNEKRALRLLKEALTHAKEIRREAIVEAFRGTYPAVVETYETLKPKLKKDDKDAVEASTKVVAKRKMKSPSYHDVFDDEENKKYPLVGVELRPIKSLKFIDDFDFRAPDYDEKFTAYAEQHIFDDGQYPAMIREDGTLIDGNRRVRLAIKEGRSDYMCVVRRVPSDDDVHVLSVLVNLRLLKPSKIDLYYAIGALSDLGLSQQKIASYVGTSRTNVLVYAKVRDKASLKVRALFEDGLIQVTNASACADLADDVQDDMATFIRKYGPLWSKGSKFNDLHQAAVQGELASFIEKMSPNLKAVTTANEGLSDKQSKAMDVAAQGASSGALSTVDARVMHSMKKRIEVFEESLKDAEIWAQRRESVITQQTDELQASRDEVESLKRELEASELMKFSSPKVIEAELKQLKAFYQVSERMAGAKQALTHATKDMQRMHLSRKQSLELNSLFDEVDQALNTLRVSIVNSLAERK